MICVHKIIFSFSHSLSLSTNDFLYLFALVPFVRQNISINKLVQNNRRKNRQAYTKQNKTKTKKNPKHKNESLTV